MNQTSDIRSQRIARRPLGEAVAVELVEAIVGGRYPAESVLPSESELADAAGVSRMTIREAIKILRAENVVRVQPGRGTFVNGTSQWTGLKSLVLAEQAVDGDVAGRLIEARRLIEVGVAELAAERRTAEDLELLSETLTDMAEAHRRGDVEAVVVADLAFHHGLMDAVGNVFISALMEPLRQVLKEVRTQTSQYPQIREHALAQHRAILEAVRDGDSVAAGAAMSSHIDQTRDDFNAFILPGADGS